MFDVQSVYGSAPLAAETANGGTGLSLNTEPLNTLIN
jgi:hypothetical protein